MASVAASTRDAGTLRGARSVVARHVGSAMSRGALIWGTAFAVVVLASVAGYISAYPDTPSRLRVSVALSSNAGLSALFGRPRRLDTVAGFVAWRAAGLLTLVGSVWGILATTRALRGEEDVGRWELLLVGQTNRRRAARSAIAGIAVGLVVLWGMVAVGAVVSTRIHDARIGVPGALYLAVCLVLPTLVFAAVAALTSQLGATRRRAAATAGAVFGVAYLLRVVANSGESLRWIEWLTPLGWIDRLHPLTGADPIWLVPVAILVALLTGVAVWLAAHRDVGASALPDRDSREPRLAYLGSTLGLSLRLLFGVVVGWVLAAAMLGLVFGLIAKSAATLTQSAALRRTLERLGVVTANGAVLYLGFAFLLIGALVALAAAGQVAATREEEASGFLDNLLVHPVRRVTWIVERLAIVVVTTVVLGLTGATLSWAGATAQHTHIGFAHMLGAGLNVVPAALVVVGIGTLVHGVAPRLTSAVAYGLVAWSLLVELVGSVLDANHWLLDTSLFHHVALAPSTHPRGGTSGVLIAVAAVTAAIGVLAFRRRDIAGA